MNSLHSREHWQHSGTLLHSHARRCTRRPMHVIVAVKKFISFTPGVCREGVCTGVRVYGRAGERVCSRMCAVSRSRPYVCVCVSFTQSRICRVQQQQQPPGQSCIWVADGASRLIYFKCTVSPRSVCPPGACVPVPGARVAKMQASAQAGGQAGKCPAMLAARARASCVS